MPGVLKRPIKKLAGPAVKPAPSGGGALTKPKPKLGGGFGQAAKDEHKVRPGGAFAKARVETERYEERRNQPFRVNVPVGEELELYFLDKGEPWTRYEHNIGGGPNSRGEIFPCIKDSGENCPACAKENKEGAFVMFLTAVVPQTTYIPKKGDNKGKKITQYFRKQLFPIKVKMSKKYERLYRAHGSFRGMVVKVSRDNQMDAGTGNDVEVVRIMDEKEINELARNPPVRDKDQKKRIIDSKINEAFDYGKLMPMPDRKKLAAMIGSSSRSAGDDDSADDDSDDGDNDGATGWGDAG